MNLVLMFFLKGEGERFGGIFYILNPSFLILPNKRNFERNKVKRLN